MAEFFSGYIWPRAYADLGNFDDAWRCIVEAMTTVETTKERWFEAEINRIAGEIALLLPEPAGSTSSAHSSLHVISKQSLGNSAQR